MSSHPRTDLVVESWFAADRTRIATTTLKAVAIATAIDLPERPEHVAPTTVEESSKTMRSRRFVAALLDDTLDAARIRIDSYLDGELEQTWIASESPRSGEEPLPFGLRVYTDDEVIAMVIVHSTIERNGGGKYDAAKLAA